MRFKVGDYIVYHNLATKEKMPAIVLKTYDDKMDLFWLNSQRSNCGYLQDAIAFRKISQ
jgi:hypothetical protein